MEQTLGKRIVSSRKGLGLTQDQLAEKLGVTAQAVSKWENDQSCPDISMLPRLAEIFGTSTDALLGLEPPAPVRDVEVMEETDPDGTHVRNGTWEFRWDSGRKSRIGFALWVLLVGGLLLAASLLHWPTDLWEIAWPSGVLLFGLFGLFPRFSFFRLGCALFGGYCLLDNLNVPIFHVGSELLLALGILLFGFSLLADALKKKDKSVFSFHRNGGSRKQASSCVQDGETFSCETSFGEDRQLVQLPRLSSGAAEVSFGSLTVDLRGCGEIAEGCAIHADCAFGELRILVPRHCMAETHTSTAFGAVNVKGEPDPGADTVIHLNCDASFGQITVQYL